MFRCHHSTAGTILWKLNGENINNNNLPPGVTPDSIREDNRLVYTLNVLGHSEYDGAAVVGVAVFLDNSSPNKETQPAAVLQGLYMYVTDNIIMVFSRKGLYAECRCSLFHATLLSEDSGFRH